MKKIFLFVAVISAFSFASCKKDRTCTCTTTSTAAGSVATTGVITITIAKKSDAKKMCIKSTNTYLDWNGVSVTDTQDCKLN